MKRLQNFPSYIKGATFTVTVGSLIENGYDLGLKSYPIFDEAYRDVLNNKILQHYWFREIGFETPALFKNRLNVRMNEIMPYYNELYATANIKYDPFNNYDLTSDGNETSVHSEDHDSKRSENSSTSSDAKAKSNSENKSRALVSTTPQTQLSGREDYATNVSDTISTTSGDNDSVSNGTAVSNIDDLTKMLANNEDNYIRHVKGLTGITKSSALMQYRDAIINVDIMVLDNLSDLFMMIYTDYWNGL